MRSEDSKDPKSGWSRLDGVDLLRGLAIFYVLMNHVNMQLLFARVPYTVGMPHQLETSLVWSGQFGVQIFFAISGFLITSTTLRRWGSLPQVSLTGFYRIRFARIAPLLLLLLAVLSCLHFARVRHFVVSAETGGLGRALFAALTFHINYLEASRGYLPGNWDILWSFSVEEMFYLFFPLVCRFLGRQRVIFPVLLLFVVMGPLARSAAFHQNPVWYEYSYLGGMDAIALGCITALLLSKVHLSSKLIWTIGTIGTLTMIFSLCFSNQARRWGLNRNGLDMTVLAIGTCMIIAVAAQTRWRSPRMLAPVLKMGERSYEVYLTHMFVVLGVFQLFLWMGKPLRLVPVLFITVIVLAGILGELVARFYSEPMNRHLRKSSEVTALSATPV